MDANKVAEAARRCSRSIRTATTDQKNAALAAVRRKLLSRKADVVCANRADMSDAEAQGLRPSLVNRLRFDEKRIDARVRSLRKIEALPDPIGQTYGADLRPNGLRAARMRVPIGVILMIYEARPHVTVNGGALCLKSGNAVILRGGSEARRCNALLGDLWRESLCEAGLPEEAIQVISGSHEEIGQLLEEAENIDLVVPRGGKGLIRAVAEQSRIPVIKHFTGVCHVYVGHRADTRKALRIILDSKLLMPEVCNAVETVLVDSSMRAWLPLLAAALMDNGIELRGCDEVLRACEKVAGLKRATEEDWSTEYLDRILSIRVVEGADAAIEHIALHGSGHTDAIVTEDYSHAQRFVSEVDSSVVLVNASTMFCDAESLGMGAEIGISTDKLHARGPMGLEELTSYKHVIIGSGQVMGDKWSAEGKVEAS